MTNSADPDQLASSEAKYLDLHCLPLYFNPSPAEPIYALPIGRAFVGSAGLGITICIHVM